MVVVDKNNIIKICLILLVISSVIKLVLMIREVVKTRKLDANRLSDIAATAAGATLTGVNIQ